MQDFVGQLYGWFTFGCSVHHRNAPSSAASPWHGHPKTRDRRKYDHYHQDLRKLARLQPVIFRMEMEQRVFFNLEQQWTVPCQELFKQVGGATEPNFRESRRRNPCSEPMVWPVAEIWLKTRSFVRFVEMKVDMSQLFQCMPLDPGCPANQHHLRSWQTTGWINNTNGNPPFVDVCISYWKSRGFHVISYRYSMSISAECIFCISSCWPSWIFGCSPGAGFWPGIFNKLSMNFWGDVGSKLRRGLSHRNGSGGIGMEPRRISYG